MKGLPAMGMLYALWWLEVPQLRGLSATAPSHGLSQMAVLSSDKTPIVAAPYRFLQIRVPSVVEIPIHGSTLRLPQMELPSQDSHPKQHVGHYHG